MEVDKMLKGSERNRKEIEYNIERWKISEKLSKKLKNIEIKVKDYEFKLIKKNDKKKLDLKFNNKF